MRVGTVSDTQQGHIKRAPRFHHSASAELETAEGGLSAEVRDISESGVALDFKDMTRIPRMENGAFVELHIEGLGQINGNVARTYDGGLAVHFDRAGLERQRIAQHVSQLYGS